jgi:GNAT superfamily N-acetyltransferase
VRKDDTTAQLRMLLVEPRARGLGIGSRLVEEVLRFARRAGYCDVTLWTNDVPAGARRIYQRAGFTLTTRRVTTASDGTSSSRTGPAACKRRDQPVNWPACAGPL